LGIALCWATDEWNRPDRTDHYLMRVAVEVARSRVKHPERVTLEDMKLTWGKAEEADDWQSRKKMTVMLLGGPGKVRHVRSKTPVPRPNHKPPPVWSGKIGE
jgi:hypothetical protein